MPDISPSHDTARRQAGSDAVLISPGSCSPPVPVSIARDSAGNPRFGERLALEELSAADLRVLIGEATDWRRENNAAANVVILGCRARLDALGAPLSGGAR